MNKITELILLTNTSYKNYIIKTYLINTGGAIFIGFLLYTFLEIINVDMDNYSNKYFECSFFYFSGSIILSPVVETFILVGIINVMRAYTSNFGRIAIFSGLIWGFIHSFFNLFSFPVIVWEFFVMSLVYIHMSNKGFWLGYSSSLILHVLNNFSALMFLFIVGSIC